MNQVRRDVAAMRKHDRVTYHIEVAAHQLLVDAADQEGPTWDEDYPGEGKERAKAFRIAARAVFAEARRRTRP